MLSAEEIAALYGQRVNRLAGRHGMMREASDVYYGRKELPLPELSKNEKAAVPNLCQQGTDQLARRIASVLPGLTYPPLRPGIALSNDKAAQRRNVNYGWWGVNNIKKSVYRRARWYVAYGSAPAVVRPDPGIVEGGGPRWDVHSPFDVFPAVTWVDSYTPPDVILRHYRTLGWLKDNHPEAYSKLRKRHKHSLDDVITALEYIGPDEVVWCACGQENKGYEPFSGSPGDMSVELTRVPNRAGICWVVIPERVGLDGPLGQFDGIFGMYSMQAALMALEVHAARNAIWPKTWLVNPNSMAIPQIVQSPDPRTGTPGKVTNGIIDRQNLDPGYRGMDVINHLEASQRQTAALPAELGGSGSQNVRTGRRGSQIMAASLDFTIAEAQDAFAEALHEENVRAIAIERAYFDKRKTFHVNWPGSEGYVAYTPSEIWEDGCVGIVEYPVAGTDLSDLVINAGQRVGMGTMSKESFMDIDPLVKNKAIELQRVKFEAIETAGLSAIQTLAANPDGPMQLPDLVRIARKMFAEGKVWYDAVAEVQEEKQREQAQGAPMGSPETMPGLAMPGQGAEVPAAIPGLGPGGEDVTNLLSQLGVADMALGAR